MLGSKYLSYRGMHTYGKVINNAELCLVDSSYSIPYSSAVHMYVTCTYNITRNTTLNF